MTKNEVESLYTQYGSIASAACAAGVSYPTFWAWLKKYGIKRKKVGYTKPKYTISPSECRLARQLLGYDLREFSKLRG